MNVSPKIPTPVNEPVLGYAPGSPERVELKRTLKDMSSRQLEIPLVIGGKEDRTGRTVDVVMPHCHRHVLAKAHQAGPAESRRRSRPPGRPGTTGRAGRSSGGPRCSSRPRTCWLRV